MDEDAFRLFYERTARSVWVYLSRMTGDAGWPTICLQEAYYRFLRATSAYESDAHRRNYLFRIATNLVRDHRAGPRLERLEPLPEAGERPSSELAVSRRSQRIGRRGGSTWAGDEAADPRERDLLWLAYAQGSSHDEIAAVLGLEGGEHQVAVVPCKTAARRPARTRAAGHERSSVVKTIECPRESDVLEAVILDRWSDELRQHADGCAVCRDLATVATVFHDEREDAWREARLPTSGQVWWRASTRRAPKPPPLLRGQSRCCRAWPARARLACPRR